MHSSIPNLNPFFPDENFLRIKEYFGDANFAIDKEDIDFPADKCLVFLCFTNRCGSNYVAQSIGSSGFLNVAQESLNHNKVINVSKSNNIKSYKEYIFHLLNNTSHNKIAVKVTAGQLIGLYNTGVFSTGRLNFKFIHVIREDVLSQAVSLYIANKTKKWTSEQSGLSDDICVSYEPDSLISMAHRLMCHNATFDFFFNIFKIEPFKIVYEEFVKDPVNMVNDVGRYIGIDDLEFCAEKITLKKQSNIVNRELLLKLSDSFKFAK